MPWNNDSVKLNIWTVGKRFYVQFFTEFQDQVMILQLTLLSRTFPVYHTA